MSGLPYAEYGPEWGTRPSSPEERRRAHRLVAKALDLPDAHPLFCEWGPPVLVLGDPEAEHVTFEFDQTVWAREFLQPAMEAAARRLVAGLSLDRAPGQDALRATAWEGQGSVTKEPDAGTPET